MNKKENGRKPDALDGLLALGALLWDETPGWMKIVLGTLFIVAAHSVTGGRRP